MIVIKKIKPLFTSLVTTMERYSVDELDGSIIDPSKVQGQVKEFQRVVAVGPSIRDIKEGDLVKINPSRYAIRKFHENSVKADMMENQIVGYNIPQVEMEGQTYLLLQDRDIEFVIEDFEETSPTEIIQSEPSIIL